MNGLPAPSTNNIQKPSINLKTFDYDAPLLMYQPFNIVVLLTLYSPIIVTLGVLSMSFIFQNFKGFLKQFSPTAEAFVKLTAYEIFLRIFS
jgi:hypothetical protein